MAYGHLSGKITGANTGDDGTGSNAVELGLLPAGEYVDRVIVQPTGDHSASGVHLFACTAPIGDGSTNYEIGGVTMPTVSGSGNSAIIAAGEIVVDAGFSEDTYFVMTSAVAPPTNGFHVTLVHATSKEEFNT